MSSAPLRLTLLLGVLIALTPLGTDLYLPALPAIGQALQAPVDRTQHTVTTFFLGLAIGQLAGDRCPTATVASPSCLPD